jgi:NAD(P)-dependent dehydrogenase (short-subunit alcohol dehydrogenase family)
MVQNGGGVIVNISSQAAMTGDLGPHYAATKSALDSLSKGISREYKHKGIRVHSISPTAQLHKELVSEQELKSIIESISHLILLLSAPSTSLLNGEILSINEEVHIK